VGATGRSRPAGRRRCRSFDNPVLDGAQREEHRAGGEEEQEGFEDHRFCSGAGFPASIQALILLICPPSSR